MPLHQLFMIFLLVSLCNSGTILVSSDNEQPKHVKIVSKALEAKTFGLIRDLIFGPTKTTSTTTTAPAVIATSDDCRCGIKTGNRILGGLETEVSPEDRCQHLLALVIVSFKVNEYPWMAIFAKTGGLEQKGCGATLVLVKLSDSTKFDILKIFL